MNAITVLEDYSLFSTFGAYLMKAVKGVNRAFDLDCLSNKKQSTMKDFFKHVVSNLIKRKTRRKKTSLFLSSTQSLCCFLILYSLSNSKFSLSPFWDLNQTESTAQVLQVFYQFPSKARILYLFQASFEKFDSGIIRVDPYCPFIRIWPTFV